MKFLNIKTDAEIENLSSLANEIWKEYWTVILSPAQIDYMLNKFQSPSAIKMQIVGEKYIYMLLEDGENIVGYFGVSPRENYLFLSKLYVKKKFRKMGYGKMAFDKIKQIAIELDKKKVQLTVNKNNFNTINSYEKWGFKTIDAVVTDIGCGFVMDDYIMEYSLEEN